jgi:hypothetical protein
LELFIDVSGSPYYHTYFGLVSFNVFTKDDILDDLFDQFPQYLNKKGKNLNKYDFIAIIRFLNQRNVKMFVLPITANDWRYYKSKYGTDHEFLQKISGITYFFLFKNIARKNNRYSVVSCAEKQLGKINRVFHHCERLGNINNIKFNFYHGHDYDNRGVKIADFIAHSWRKLKLSDITSFTNYKIIKQRLPNWYLRIIFT